MSTERRVDPYTGRSILIAPTRSGLGGSRPSGLPDPLVRCPFCPGHEADTEPTVAQWPASGDWEVRVVRNKFPIVGDAGPPGVHEVVIDAREHRAELNRFEVAHIVRWLEVIRGRMQAHLRNSEVAAVTVFRNRGRRAGSSQPHPHSQIVATGWVSEETALRWRRTEAARTPIHVQELARELAGPRLIEADAHVVTYCPYAPTRPYEVRFSPQNPRGGFATATDSELATLASALRRVCTVLRGPLGIEDYNLIWREPPARAEGPAAAWHVELLPRTGGDAGFEVSTGQMIVVVPPELAAVRYREAHAQAQSG